MEGQSQQHLRRFPASERVEATQTMTALPHEMLTALFAGQFVVAVAGVLLGFKLLEANWGLGFTGSVALALGILAGEWYIGDILWDPQFTAPQLREAVLAAVAGAVLAIALTITLFEPDTDGCSAAADDRRRPGGNGRPKTTESPEIPGGLGED